jgi:hypothetical protein
MLFGWSREDHNVTSRDTVEFKAQLVHHNAIADVQGRHHGSRRDEERLHNERAQ